MDATNEEKLNLDSLDENQELSREMMEKLYSETMQNFKEGNVIKGKIISISDDMVMLDVGYKSEGYVPISEFYSHSGEMADIKVGDEIEVYLDMIEDQNGQIVLSREKALKVKVWEELLKAYERDEIIQGKIISRIKGGMTVDIGIKAFLPGSQIDLRPVKNMDELVGKTFDFKIINVNHKRGNIVISRRKILEEEREKKKVKTMEKIKEGEIVDGIVKNITEYGVFIDLGGIDGLLHITDMTWGRINHPSEMFKIGDEIKVKILKIEPETEKVSLGLKQITENPWNNVEEKYPVGEKVRGRVVSLTDYGAFIELEKGIEGLIHISEMSWTKKIRHPSKILAVGDNVEAVVLSIDKESKKISLGLKQCEPNPWDIIEEKYPPGSIVEGEIKSITDFGIFIGLEEGIDGMIHISDLSWSKKIKHPSEIVKKGETIKAKVLKIDRENERVSLSLKHLEPDPWEEAVEKYKVGDIIKGKIIKFANFGAFIEIEDGVEGLIHISELSTKNVDKPEDAVTLGEEVEAKIIRIDSEEKKIGLSIRELLEEREKKEITDYLEDQEKFEPKLKTVIDDSDLKSDK
ncbi:MAG: 30S ribosomal protein S1 [Candidatus Schekmanbacteria bacterium]|nr:MAG: 30S ribosomal protein S1 [Candidatus Schekmanbacteria bacterium]